MVPQDSGSLWPQNLLIITAIKSDKSRVKDYIHRLDNFDGPAVGGIAVGYEMFEEAFEIYKKFNLQVWPALCTMRGCTSTCDAVAATHPRRLCRSESDAAPHAPWHMSFAFANGRLVCATGAGNQGAARARARPGPRPRVCLQGAHHTFFSQLWLSSSWQYVSASSFLTLSACPGCLE